MHRLIIQTTVDDWIAGAAYQKGPTLSPANAPMGPRERAIRVAVTVTILSGCAALFVLFLMWMSAAGQFTGFNLFASFGLIILFVAMIWHILWPEPMPLLNADEIAEIEEQFRANGTKEYCLEISPQGILVTWPDHRNGVDWPAIGKIVVTRQYIYIHEMAGTVYFVPRRCFPGDREFDAFMVSATAWRDASAGPQTGIVASGPPGAGVAKPETGIIARERPDR